jgi:hypothetical protein
VSHRTAISAHAIVRFIERNDGLDLSDVRRKCGGPEARTTEILRCLARDHGVDIGAVRRRMDTPAVRIGVAMGANAVHVGRVRLIIKDGCVVTAKRAEWDRCAMGEGWSNDRTTGRVQTKGRQGGAAKLLEGWE